VLNQHYNWDSLSNLTGRIDNNGDGGSGAVSETFSYAAGLNRLTSYTVTAPQIPGLTRTVNLQYNALGMLLYKSDVGNYSYAAQGAKSVRPHALQSVAGSSTTSFTYDANGNLTAATAGKYRTLSYTSFNLPDSQSGIQGPSGTPKYTWQYDEGHARIKEVRVDSTGTRTTWYLHPDNAGGLSFESETGASGAISNRHYLNAGGVAIGVLVSPGEWSFQGVALHGVAGCVTSVVNGSKCGPGALSAAFSQAALPYKPEGIVGGTAASMVIGGTASVLGGGKFANGAETAAFGYLFNCSLHPGACAKSEIDKKVASCSTLRCYSEATDDYQEAGQLKRPTMGAVLTDLAKLDGIAVSLALLSPEAGRLLLTIGSTAESIPYFGPEGRRL
jgi:YD repeat-containing protein